MSNPADLPSKESSASFWHTEPKLLGHRTTEDLPQQVDIVVIGSGISGASVIHHIFENTEDVEDAEQPSVLVLEAREVCWGATGRNGGHCLPILHEHPHDPAISTFEYSNYLALSHLITSLDISCEWHSQQGIRGLYSSSEVTLAKHAIATLHTTNPTIAKLCRVISTPEELREVGLAVPEAKGAVISDVAARLWPYKLVVGIWERLLLATPKLNLQTHTSALSITSSGNGTWVIQTDRGMVEAKKVVLATNAYTSHLLPQMADLIVPCRGQMSALLPGTAFSGSHRTRTNFGFMGPRMDDYLIQRPDESCAHLMFGGGRSYGPSLGITSDKDVDEKVAKYLRTELPRLLVSKQEHGGEQELTATHQWTGIMGFSRDNLPWVGQVPGSKGVFVLAGYTGHGMPNAWLCGKSVATMVLGGDVDVAVDKAVEQGLPRAYLLNDERIEKARKLDTVEAQDEDHAFRAEVVAEA
ncbi:FAD dependent oxidoreductase [Aureobasidium sp. EXF-8845]|nr:FAD dependent oxidoreductase [Aureobasidium sp. EXF-8845]KAI4849003.1 FAD dependent oxidoreductase [Aureobasidium sp. EXF-8846]